MSILAILAAGRTAAESLMTDACTIAHYTGMGTPNATTGATTPTYGTAFYTGKCKVQARNVDATVPEAGDRAVTVLRLRVDVPMSVEGVEVSDLVTITASAYDPDLVGATFRVTAPFHASHKTARRLPVEESP